MCIRYVGNSVWMKVSIVIWLCVMTMYVMAGSVRAEGQRAEGTWGDNITWQLSEDGTLTLTGEGRMIDCGSGQAQQKEYPWGSFRMDIRKIVLTEGITYIPKSAFCYFSALQTVNLPLGLEEIGQDAFSECSGLQELVIPDMVARVGEEAFSGCKSLKTVTFKSTGTKVTLGKRCFIGCEALSDVVLPKNITELPCTFMNCTSLAEIVIPDTVRELDGTFAGCSALEKITIPGNVTKLEGALFWKCVALKSIIIQSNQLNLKENDNKDIMFYGISKDAVLVLPNQKYKAYRGALAFILPSTVVYKDASGKIPDYSSASKLIGRGDWGGNISWVLEKNGTLTFSGKGKMKEGCVYFTYYTYSKKERYPWSQYAGSIQKVVVKKGITGIANGAFDSLSQLYYNDGYSCPFDRLETVEMADTVKTIGNSAFRENKCLRRIRFSKNLISIGKTCFSRCSRIETLDLPDSLRKIGEKAFIKCTKLKKVVVPEQIQSLGYTFQSCKSLESVTLPQKLKSMKGVFSGCTALKSIVIPSNVETVDLQCFYQCRNLRTVDIKSGKLTRLGGRVFAECKKLETITLPDSLKTIDYRAFYKCTKLSQITIPKKVRTIGLEAFRACTGLKKVVFCENVNSTLTMERLVFKDCSRLEQVKLSDNIKKMRYTFQNCTALKEVQLPQQLVLMEKTFTNCSSLQSITIPDKVETIYDKTFYGCSDLRRIRIESEKLTISQQATGLFGEIAPDAVFILPKKMYQKYQSVIRLSAPKTVRYEQAARS